MTLLPKVVTPVRCGYPSSQNAAVELLSKYTWNYENAEEDDATLKVGQLKPSPWSLHDMRGIVSEWVLDQHDAGHDAKFAGQTVDSSEIVNWPTKLYPCILRGASW